MNVWASVLNYRFKIVSQGKKERAQCQRISAGIGKNFEFSYAGNDPQQYPENLDWSVNFEFSLVGKI